MGVAVVIWAFAVVGTPRMARMKELDRERVSDLQAIHRKIDDFYQRKGELPASLDELYLDNTEFSDPESGESYGYVIQDRRHYRISATFSLADDGSSTWYGESWKHEAGHQEFSFTVRDKGGSADDAAKFTGV